MLCFVAVVLIVGGYRDFTDVDERKRRERKARYWWRRGMNRYPAK